MSFNLPDIELQEVLNRPGISIRTQIGQLARSLPVPLVRESRLAAEYAALRRDPVYRCGAVNLGHGRPVLLIPGFLAGDWSLSIAYDWLRRLNYRPALAGISVNVRASEHTLDGLAARLRALHRATGAQVTIVGHSRGGLLAKVLADRHPEEVDQVIALGSPLADTYAVYPVTRAAVEMARMYNRLRFRLADDAEDEFLRELSQPPLVPVTSIYTRSDGVVDWRTCIRPDVRTVEVRGSHGGLATNPEVYRVLLRTLRPLAAH